MKNKFLPYIVVLLVLIIAIAVFVSNRETSGDKEAAFAVKSAEKISKVVLEDADKHTIVLEQLRGVWMVNGKYPARVDLVNSLFEALTRVTTLCPVPNAAHDNVVREMLGKHVKVQVFTGDEEPEKVYFVGGPSVDGQNTYMLMEIDGKPASRPQMTYIPSARSYLTPRFETDEETWRSRVVFNYAEEDIEKLTVEYPEVPHASFSIARAGKDSFALSPLDEKHRNDAVVPQRYIQQYLAFYSSISIEAFDNKNEEKDSIMKTTPYCVISIAEKDQTVNTVKLYYMPLNKRSKMQTDKNGKPMTYDIDRYYASIHDSKDFVVVQYYVFGKVLRAYQEFFKKPA